MAIEIERKFLVIGDGWREHVERTQHIADHPITTFDGGKARIRLCEGSALLTIKGKRRGIARSEYHFPVSMEQAQAMIAEFSAGECIEKMRHEVIIEGLLWQVDEYAGHNTGLFTADVELPHADHAFARPTWAGTDITGDECYSSKTLSKRKP